MKLFVSSIQHFSVGDGDGIRTTVFLKGCNLRCPWCHNPETIPAKTVILHYPTGDQENGKYKDLHDVVTEVLEDADFYADDGGVTVSGGEPLLQADAVAELLKQLKEKGIRNVIDTAGCVPYESFLKVIDFADTFFFDFKAANAEDYSKIGGNFDLVYSNLKALLTAGKNVRIRIPLIPDFNTSPEYSESMCKALLNAGVKHVDLLPFHRLGSGKYDALSIPYAYKDYPSMKISEAEEIAKTYRKYFSVKIEK